MHPNYYALLILISVFLISAAFHYFSALKNIKISFTFAAVISIIALSISLNIEPYYFKIIVDSGEVYKGNIVIPIIISFIFFAVLLTSITSGIIVNYLKNAKIKKI